MNKTSKSTASKDNTMGSNSCATREASVVVVESLISPINAIEMPVTPVESTCYKKKRQWRTLRPEKLLRPPQSLPTPRQQGSCQKQGWAGRELSDCIYRLHCDQLHQWDSVFGDTSACPSL